MTEETLTKGERTRIQIEDAAVQLFLERGYHATSMRLIADRAGLALGGIYNHFSSKDEIFEAIIIDQHPYKRILPLLVQAKGETMEDFLRNAIKIAVETLGPEPVFVKLMFIEIVEFNGRHGAKMLKEIAPQVLPVIEHLMKSRKELRTTNPAMFLRSLFGMIISYYITETVVANSMIGKMMPKNSMEIYTDIYLHGILKETA